MEAATKDKSLERLLNEGKRYADKAKCRRTSVLLPNVAIVQSSGWMDASICRERGL
jgi:hypothetical protein